MSCLCLNNLFLSCHVSDTNYNKKHELLNLQVDKLSKNIFINKIIIGVERGLKLKILIQDSVH